MPMHHAAIAANRFGLGARPGELLQIEPRPQAWLLDQLQGPARAHAAIAALPSSDTVLVDVLDRRRRQREARRSDDDMAAAERYGRVVRRHYEQQAAARYRSAVESEQPFHERLVHFWTNHFAVSADKQPLPAIAGLFENEAIRPHIGGSFADLLLAAEQHPAMIIYLDNQRSIGSNSTAARRADRRGSEQQFGLNENLAREILELHTLGVDGGYGQPDVTAFARVLTGWSVGGGRGRRAGGDPGRFHFREEFHEPGPQVILGKRYGQQGLLQGEAVLRDLAAHPATARFVTMKLARHFVADDPPAPLLDRLADVYLDTGGDLSEVCAALVTAAESWAVIHGKYKTPHDFLVSTLRGFDHYPDRPRFIIAALDLMGQAPFRPGSPQGWPDTAAEWGGADALYKRIEWSNTVARAVGSRVNPVELGDSVLGPAFRPETRKAVARAESLSQGVTLLLASPDFQRR